jgi:hypothetical protein
MPLARSSIETNQQFCHEPQIVIAADRVPHHG